MNTAFGIPLGFVSVEITVEVIVCVLVSWGEMKVREKLRVFSSLSFELVTLN